MRERQAAVFDLDGTLIDSIADIRLSLNMMREHYCLPLLTLEQVRAAIGNGVKILIERVLSDAPRINQQEAIDYYNARYRENFAVNTKLYPGAAESLEKLYHAGFKLAIASNKPDTFCRPLMRKLGVEKLFTSIAGGTPGIAIKPAPDSVLLALRETGCLPEKSFMCGDNYTDLGAGRAAGTRVIYCSYGFGDPKEETWDFEAKDFPSLAEYILSSTD